MNKPDSRKILILTFEFPPFYGGIATYASQLAIAAHELGHDITVIAPDYGKNNAASDSKNYKFKIIRFQGTTYSFTKLPGMIWRIWRHLKQNKYDIIHAIDWSHILTMALVNRIKKYEFAATIFGSELLTVLNSRHVKLLRLYDLFSKPSQIYAISEFTKSLYIEKSRNARIENVKLTPLGVDSSWFRPANDSKNVLGKYGLDINQMIILTVARLDQRKGHRSVLKALAYLDEDLKDSLTYVIVGTGNDSKYLQELKNLALLSGVKVSFTGSIDTADLLSLYASSCVFCMPGEPHPKRVEGFGLVYLEAAAQGLPSIASSIGAVPEVVLHNKTGIIVNPLDIESITKGLERLLTDEKLRKSFGDSAKEYAKQFTWRRCAQITYD